MVEIIEKTPAYAWILLVYLLAFGIRARKPQVVPFTAILIMPIVFSIWSGYSLFSRYGYQWITVTGFVFSLTMGSFVGSWMMRGFSLKFDKVKRLVQLPGSWLPLILSLSMFGLRYFLGVSYVLKFETPYLLIAEFGTNFISGCFLGRIAHYFRQYLATPHERLSG
jgi:hypothetical protein